MATVYFNQGQVVAYKTADIGDAPPPPTSDKSFNFDPDSNQVLLSILSHEPQNLALNAQQNGLLYNGAPFTVNPDGPTETRRKRIQQLVAKGKTQPLTAAELTEVVLAIIRRVGDTER